MRTAVRRLLFDHGRDAARDAARLARADAADDAGWAEALGRVATEAVPEMPVSGRDLVARGLSGPAVGEALARFRAAYRAADFPAGSAERDALLAAAVAAPPAG